MAEPFTIFGLAGSVRRDSFNMAALRAAQDLAPSGTSIDIFEHLGDIPPFNQDDERNAPAAVADLKRRVRAADAVLFVTPEYNYSMPGVLKNAIDWASRPYGDNAWDEKPVAVMGASISLLGTARAQYHLRQCFVFLNMHPMNLPEVMIASAGDRFDDRGNLTDEMSRKLIREQLEKLQSWSTRIKQRDYAMAGS